ncbi:hypothetical protein J0H58_22875, partial [bacterium]|nr:hypothetical protein [bacterium]
MKRFLIVAGVVFAGMVLLVGVRGVGKLLNRNRPATDEQIRTERAADREEARVAFTSPVPPTPAEAEQFGRLFAALGEALDRGDVAAVRGHFDADRMATELVRFGAFEKLGVRPTERDRPALARGIEEGLGRTLVANELMRWSASRVRAVRWADGRREAVVIATHTHEIDGEVIDSKMRWWLIAAPGGGWKVYDLEDLDLGSRVTQIGAAAMSPELLAEGPAGVARVQEAAAAVREALVAVLRRDEDAADEALGRARGQRLPPPVAAFREMAEAGLALVRGDHAAALARLDDTDRLWPGTPASKCLRATALNVAGRYDEALEQARSYTAELGPDPNVLAQTGFALEGLNRTDEAAAEYRRALDEGPDTLDALHGLRRVLAADRKAELGARLAKTRDPVRTYDELTLDARDDGDAEGLAALLAGLRKARPDDPRVAEEELRTLVKDGNYADAAVLLRRRLGDAPPGPMRPPVLVAYLFAMLDADRAVEALGAVPAAHAGSAFRILAEDLEDRGFDAEPEAGPRDRDQKALAALVAARREQAPGDPWTWFYEAAGHEAAGRFDEAAKAFADGDAALAKWDGTVTDYDRDRFRSRRVFTLHRAKKGLTALAEVGPADKTFRQLAWLHVGDKDADGLAELADTHARAEPEDRAVGFFRGEAHYLKGEYEQAVPLFNKYRRGATDRDDPSRQVALDREVRARVRGGDAAGARRLVEALPTDRSSLSLRAIVAAASGDAAELGTMLRENASTPGG